MKQLDKQFLETVARESLLPRGTRVTLAVSGGSDSVAMLHLVNRFAPARGWQLDVLHINHGLRTTSSEDELFVKKLCGDLKIPFRSEHPSVPPGTGGSMESSWSKVRQEIYFSQPGVVAVGHTATDRAETVLMRLFEGAGLRGLGGMNYCGRGNVQRPMLDIRGDEIKNWLESNGHRWVEDSTNCNTEITRNRLRLEVIPLIEKHFPEAVAGICRSGKLLSGWRDVQNQLEEFTTGAEGISRCELIEMPGVLGAMTLWQMAGKPRSGFEEFRKILDWLNRGGRGRHILPGGKRLIAEDELVRVETRGPGRF